MMLRVKRTREELVRSKVDLRRAREGHPCGTAGEWANVLSAREKVEIL